MLQHVKEEHGDMLQHVKEEHEVKGCSMLKRDMKYVAAC